MKNVMVRAWEIARNAVVEFGGKVKDYFSQALAVAWKESKKMIEDQMLEAFDTNFLSGYENETSHTIKFWKKDDHKRIYFNVTKLRRTYSIWIDLITNEVTYYEVRDRDLNRALALYTDIIRENKNYFIKKYSIGN